MTGTSDFDAMQGSIERLHRELFPEPFKTISWPLLVAHLDALTKHVNKALAFYHDKSTPHEQEQLSPALCYAQALLAMLARLAKFDEKDLTRYNQIVADMEKMLIDRAFLVETLYREQAEYQHKMLHDEKLKSLMETFLASCKK